VKIYPLYYMRNLSSIVSLENALPNFLFVILHESGREYSSPVIAYPMRNIRFLTQILFAALYPIRNMTGTPDVFHPPALLLQSGRAAREVVRFTVRDV
jgi:hypothetical protein